MLQKKDYSKEIKKAISDRIANNNIKSYNDLDNLVKSSVSLFGTDVKTDAQKYQAYYDYSEGLLLNYYDINGDGKVTVDEFAQKETEGSMQTMKLQAGKVDESTRKMLAEDAEMLKFYDTNGDGEISQEEYESGNKKLGVTSFESNGSDTNKTIAERSGNLFAQNLDFNGNGLIDPEELAFFNQNADGLDGADDGVIKNAGESAMFTAVTGMNAGNPEFNRVVNKYLSGATLTADEQKILKECQQTIRKNMGKAAGINIEG